MPPEALTAAAPAKINLVLEVLGRRADGYHQIDTILQTLELADRVTLRLDEPGPTVWATGPFVEGTPCDETNLAWRAAIVLAATIGRSTERLSIELVKNIPPAGGLGGGASDAATTLRLLQRAWPEATEEHLLRAATEVGSDEAFFLAGGTARATGRGETVVPVRPLPQHGVVLFVPGQTLERKTARMFAALGALPFDDGGVAAGFVAAPPARLGGEDVYNAFERVAYDLFPGLARLSEELEERTGEAIRLAGAGPTLFWIGSVEDTMAVAAAAARADCTVIPTATAGTLWAK